MTTGAIGSYQSLVASLQHQYPLLGLAMSHHVNTRGQPMTFRDKPYLVELYRDLPNIEGADFMKAVQTGISEVFVQLMLERSGWQGRVCAYVLPTFTIRDRFVQNRIDPLLQQVPVYRGRAEKTNSRGGTGNLKLKRFGNGAMMFLGSNTPGDFVEFSADILVVDEYDQCDPGNLSKARDRLRASPYPQSYTIGNPSIPGVGISRLFRKSDQRRWFVQCPHCNERQPIDWFVNMVRRNDSGAWVPRDQARVDSSLDLRPVCRRCSEPFDRVADGACWVAENPGVHRRGYQMSRMDILSESMRRLHNEWVGAQGDTSALSTFYTSVLGVPFEYSGSRLTFEMLERVATGPELDYGGGSEYETSIVTMGVDVGSLLHFSISLVEGHDEQDRPIRRVIYAGTVTTFEEIADLVERYRVDYCVIDSMPETRKAQELRDHFMLSETVVWLCRFHPTPRVARQMYGLKMNYRDRVCTVDRTQVFDATFEDIKENRRIFPEDIFTLLGWNQQMRAPVRVLDEERSRIIWSEGASPDHFRLADIYDRIAYDLSQLGGTYHAG